MERELYRQLYRLLCRVAIAASQPRRPRGARFSDVIVLACYLWAVLHDRPVCWAAQQHNWHDDVLAFELPSQSTLSRRLRSASVARLLAALHESLTSPQQQRTPVKVMDSKPLPVGGHSAAKDARWGHGGRSQCKGYKLHAIYGNDAVPIAWEVVPMNASEQRVAKRLLRHLRGGGYVLADSVYDINALYEIAAEMNHQLLSWRKRPYSEVGHRDHSRHRLRGIEMLESDVSDFGRGIYQLRTSIERRFSQLCTPAGGLGPLPAWVRTLRRVRMWVSVKLLISAVRRREKAGLAA
jgi:hypothetical protein